MLSDEEIKRIAEAYINNAIKILKEKERYDRTLIKEALKIVNLKDRLVEILKRLAMNTESCTSCSFGEPYSVEEFPELALNLNVRKCRLGLNPDTCDKYQIVEL